MSADEPLDGNLTLPGRQTLLAVRFRVCVPCLSSPELREANGTRRCARVLAARLWDWYATYPLGWPTLSRAVAHPSRN
jgi:hypothetical protein